MFFIDIAWKYDPSKKEKYEDWKKNWKVKWEHYNETYNVVSTFSLKECTREDFVNFNATNIYDNIDALDPLADLKNYTVRYCFDIPKNVTLPEYGNPFKGGNGTFYNKIKIAPNSAIPKS